MSLNQVGYITEVFQSIQGEGKYLGIMQVFIRFSGCNLNCAYCDTKYAKKKNKYCIVYERNNEKYKIRNPVDIPTLYEIVNKLNNNSHSISITGGEPLLQVDFLIDFLKVIKQNNYRIYLETNGILYHNLLRIINLIDIVSMDYKLKSDVGRNYVTSHKKFLQTLNTYQKEYFVKIVITPNTKIDELKQAVAVIREINENVTLILQPSSRKLVRDNKIQNIINELTLNDIRIIPQLHKLIGLMA